MGAALIIGIVFGFVGSILFIIGVFIFIRTRAFISRAQAVKGTVIKMLSSSGSEGGTVYAPVFRFTTIEGQSMEVAESVYSNPPGYSVGDVVEVLYDPQNPSNARTSKMGSLYFVPLLLGGLGGIFACVGGIMLIFKIIDLIRS